MSHSDKIKINVEVENVSSLRKKLKIRVPAESVKDAFNRNLFELQKTADLKGFRRGQVPLAMVKNLYADSLRHRLFHDLVEASFEQAVSEQALKAVGEPEIQAPAFKTGGGDHDHGIREDEDFFYEATLEVLPKFEVKGYTGISCDIEISQITDQNVQKVVDHYLEAHSEMVPVGVEVLPDGSQGSRAIAEGDFVDLGVSGGLFSDQGVQEVKELKYSYFDKVGPGHWRRGADEKSDLPDINTYLLGMKRGEVKKINLLMPDSFPITSVAGRDVQLVLNVAEIKEKKIPSCEDHIVKQFGYESVLDLKQVVKETLKKQQEDEFRGKLRDQLLMKIMSANPFEVPEALVLAQTEYLASELFGKLKVLRWTDEAAREKVLDQWSILKMNAEKQVRITLILDFIAKAEGIKVSDEEFLLELMRISKSEKISLERLTAECKKYPEKKQNIEFQLWQKLIFSFLIEKAEVRKVSPEQVP